MSYKQILIVQTAFIGDVILATGLIEKIHQFYPEASIDFALRKGNESLLKNHPKLREVHIWDKKGGKYRNLFKLISKIRSKKYDLVINIQRFANAGLLTALSGAKEKIGFDKNPFSWAFTTKIAHKIEEGVHETARNNELVKALTNNEVERPALYPSTEDFEKIVSYTNEPFVCMAPASIWFTKQYPKEKWVELIKALDFAGNIYILGAPGDKALADEIITTTGKDKVHNLCGSISLLQSAALMKTAVINYVNDSAPMHLASSVNANTCAIYCSTVPEFGFGPLADFAEVVEVNEKLDCRPCGLHGYKACPKGHFKCGFDIDTQRLVDVFELTQKETPLESYIQYAGGYQKDNISIGDIEKAIVDIQLMDEEHGAFWVSVIDNDENVLSVNKNLSVFANFEDRPDKEFKLSVNNWEEVKSLLILLLSKDLKSLQKTFKAN